MLVQNTNYNFSFSNYYSYYGCHCCFSESFHAEETTSSASSLTDCQCHEKQLVNPHAGSVTGVISGILELLSLLRILGEAYRFSCLYRCRVIPFY